ncbi:MAG: cytochrome c biogenesis protein CcsA [Coriobacteriia bacterium]|nr:cytochrome c biogenesis protein CcsA [Coriobacteriia bacterium]
MEQLSVVLYWFAFALYVVATVLYAYQFVLRRQKVAWWARFATGAGFILQTLAIGANSVANDGTPLTGSNQLVLASWALVLLYFVMEHLLKIRSYGAFLIPVAVVLMAAAQLMGGSEASLAPQPEILSGWGVAFHVGLIVFANAGFAVGAVSALLYLYQSSQLKSHRSNRMSRRLPSLATLQMVSRRAIALAFPVYTAGLSLGIIRAIQVDVGGWFFDARIMMSGVVLITFAIYLVLAYRPDISNHTVAWVAVLGFVFVVILAIIARTLPVGFHVFGQL